MLDSGDRACRDLPIISCVTSAAQSSDSTLARRWNAMPNPDNSFEVNSNYPRSAGRQRRVTVKQVRTWKKERSTRKVVKMGLYRSMGV
jgi:hypothetical protein